ncbi:unnamed protein product, partial [Amoebophrya sp. A120]
PRSTASLNATTYSIPSLIEKSLVEAAKVPPALAEILLLPLKQFADPELARHETLAKLAGFVVSKMSYNSTVGRTDELRRRPRGTGTTSTHDLIAAEGATATMMSKMNQSSTSRPSLVQHMVSRSSRTSSTNSTATVVDRRLRRWAA